MKSPNNCEYVDGIRWIGDDILWQQLQYKDVYSNADVYLLRKSNKTDSVICEPQPLKL